MRHAPLLAERTTRPLRVLLLLGNWIGGGAERVAVHLMHALPAHWDVRLGLLHAGDAWLDELDPARVMLAAHAAERFRYDRPNAELVDAATLVNGALHAPRAFRTMIAATRPDVVLSFLKGTAILTWLALAGLRQRPRWIAREGNNILATTRAESPCALVRRASLGLTGMAYRRADAVLTNARAMARDMATQFRIDPVRLHTIPNPVDLERIARAVQSAPPPRPPRPYLLAAGRLEIQKGHDLLLTAFAASQAARSHDLVILGQGSLAAKLRNMAQSLGVGHAVHFVGFAENPYSWMAGADLFVLPSRWEGFPNAAAEAMAAGAPVLLADCDYGPRELVGPAQRDVLFPVGDSAALAAGIDRMIAAPSLRAANAAAGQMRVKRFAIDQMVARYTALIAEVANERAPSTAPLTLAAA